MKILIVEDEINILKPYQIKLESKGHQVTTSQDGETCLKIYREANTGIVQSEQTHHLFKPLPFDVVIIDYRIPKKDGMEVAKEILSINPTQRIIFASAYVKIIIQREVAELKQHLDLVENLQKPFDLNTLVKKVEFEDLTELLNKHGFKNPSIDDMNKSYSQLKQILKNLENVKEKYSIELSN
ncbi:MAG: response regulator [Thaumarchaeota archaeon]|nr:MAG: response regulator [Nitrososphaerota archaeon]